MAAYLPLRSDADYQCNDCGGDEFHVDDGKGPEWRFGLLLLRWRGWKSGTVLGPRRVRIAVLIDHPPALFPKDAFWRARQIGVGGYRPADSAREKPLAADIVIGLFVDFLHASPV